LEFVLQGRRTRRRQCLVVGLKEMNRVDDARGAAIQGRDDRRSHLGESVSNRYSERPAGPGGPRRGESDHGREPGVLPVVGGRSDANQQALRLNVARQETTLLNSALMGGAIRTDANTGLKGLPVRPVGNLGTMNIAL